MHFLPAQWHDTLPSTNSFLVEAVRESPQLPGGTVVAAHCQTAGRGRYDRQWISQSNKDLTFSFLVRAAVPAAWIPALPMAAALAVADALEPLGVEPRTKWPNDVLVGGRKICGILSEYVPECSDSLQTAVVGIGLNVNMTAAEAADIDRPATSLFIETGRDNDIESVLNALLRTLPRHIAAWEQRGFEGLRHEWTRRAEGVGRRIAVGEGTQRKEGTLAGFGEFGELLLEDEAGQTHAVVLGDVTL